MNTQDKNNYYTIEDTREFLANIGIGGYCQSCIEALTSMSNGEDAAAPVEWCDCLEQID